LNEDRVAKEKWAFHVVAYNGAGTFGHASKKAAEKLRSEMLQMVKRGELEFVSSLIEMVPGTKHWVVHVRMEDGRMKSFGFGSQIEAQKFHQVVLNKVEGVDVASFPTEAELEK
jgi:hypothetical protein